MLYVEVCGNLETVVSRKVAGVSECSEVNLIDGTFCCNGLQFHLFSSVLTG